MRVSTQSLLLTLLSKCIAELILAIETNRRQAPDPNLGKIRERFEPRWSGINICLWTLLLPAWSGVTIRQSVTAMSYLSDKAITNIAFKEYCGTNSGDRNVLQTSARSETLKNPWAFWIAMIRNQYLLLNAAVTCMKWCENKAVSNSYVLFKRRSSNFWV